MIGSTISHYRILGQVGEGGMGTVYVAEDTRLGRRVALKIPHGGPDERHYRARFLREARAVSALSHRNIAAVFDYGEAESGQPYIVMELVTGLTLGDILTGQGLSIGRAVEIIRDVAEALAEAHRRGIVHRDIKPSNVIVDERGQVKVLDFGLAKQLDDAQAGAVTGPDAQTLLSTRTRSDVVIGTPLYLSPEQARGARVDGRSDLFALGALLYECLAGRPAFSGSNVIEIGAQVIHVDPPPPSHFNPRVPPELDRVVMRALAKRPEDRYQTAGEMAAELDRASAHLGDTAEVRTRRLDTGSFIARTSALDTLAETLRRPRFSPLALFAALVLALVGVWAFARWNRPPAHRPSGPAAELFARGERAMRDGAYYSASVFLQKALAEDDRYALAYARLAEARSEMDLLDAAKDDLLALQPLVPARSSLPERDRLYLDAVTAAVRRDYPAAVAAYERLAELDPESPQARVDLGRAYEKNEETAKAVASYTEAGTRDPSYATAFLRLGMLHARLKDRGSAAANFDRAERLYAAAGNAEGQAEVAYQRGRLFVDLVQRPEARRELARSLEFARAASNPYQQVRADIQYANMEEDPEAARRRALAAVEAAQSNGMPDLTAFGFFSLGNLSLARNDLEAAEGYYARALEVSRANKVRRYEALALIQMGSLRNKQSRLDEAQTLIEQARAYFQQGGYRKEADQAAALLGRIRRQRGDYEGALAVIRERMRFSEATGDAHQLGFLWREQGAVLLTQERLPQALESLRESYAINKRIDSRNLLIYVLINMANAYWRLGMYEEAAQAVEEARVLYDQVGDSNKDLASIILLAPARSALSRLRFAEAGDGARRALALLRQTPGAPNTAEAKAVVCLAAAAGGSRRDLRLCDEAVAEAEATGDPTYVSNARLALAEALLWSGEARRAREEAVRTRELCARLGRAESEWRALALAAGAARRAGDMDAAGAHADEAAGALARLEQLWGADAMKGFYARPDVRALRGDAEPQAATTASR